jgi:hypothetical protein
MKKILTGVMILLSLTLVSFTNVFAGDCEDNYSNITVTHTNSMYFELLTELVNQINWDISLSTGFDIVSASELPEGVIPLQADSIEDLEAILANIQYDVLQIQAQSRPLNLALNLANPFSANPFSASSMNIVSGHASGINTWAVGLTASVSLNAWVHYIPGFSIDRIDAYSRMTGFVIGTRYVQNTAGSIISAGRRTASVFASGSLEHYILLPIDILVIGRTPVNLAGIVELI